MRFFLTGTERSSVYVQLSLLRSHKRWVPQASILRPGKRQWPRCI